MTFKAKSMNMIIMAGNILCYILSALVLPMA